MKNKKSKILFIVIAVMFTLLCACSTTAVVAGTQPPEITSFTLTGANPTSDQTVDFTLEATDDLAVTGYFINEQINTPEYDTAGWVTEKPEFIKVSSDPGLKSIFAWVKDANGQISERASLTVYYGAAKPSGTSVTRGTDKLTIGWATPAEGFYTVEVYYSADPDLANRTDGTLVGSTTGSQLDHNSLTSGTNYWYAVYTKMDLVYSEPALTNGMTYTTGAKTIHFYHDSWSSVNMHYSLDEGSWTTSPGSAMNNDTGGWYSITTASCYQVECVFNDGSSWLPGGSGNNFRITHDEVWIKNGLVFTWDPDSGTKPAGEVCIVTLNLHTYQESDPLTKLEMVADMIADCTPDFVCLQECAQNKNGTPIVDPRAPFNQSGGDQIKDTNGSDYGNMAWLISKRLQDVHGQTWNYYWSWAHYGWSVWEEGVAVLTPYTIIEHDTRYVSTQNTTGSIDSRKAVYVAADVPGIGRVNVFSIHTSWGDPQPGQLDALRSLMQEKQVSSPVATIVGGDFNMTEGSVGYNRMTSFSGGDRYIDSYYLANPGGFSDVTLGSRIDYIFYHYKDLIIPKTAQLYFKQDSSWLGGRVSDHVGVIMRLEIQ